LSSLLWPFPAQLYPHHLLRLQRAWKQQAEFLRQEKIIVKTIPIIAGTALVLVGYSFQVAAVPVALSGVLLNSIGKSLVGQN
jgi:hypothetical protein